MEKHTIVKVKSGRYEFKECQECGMFICDRCFNHCHSLSHLKIGSVCDDCKEELEK